MQVRTPCIFVFGPSFAGKTCLVSRLVLDFPWFRTVNFELYYHPHRNIKVSMTGYYGHIFRLLSNGTPVIAETVNDYRYNSKYHKHDFEGLNHLNILVLPDYRLHLRNLESFREAFGSHPTNSRTGNRQLGKIRRDHAANLRITDYLTYDTTNYDVIRDRVARLLGASKEAPHGGI